MEPSLRSPLQRQPRPHWMLRGEGALERTAAAQRDYATYCRPGLAERMKALRLDLVYHRALGDWLYFFDEHGEEHAVLDFVGGFGVTFFGHNHPGLNQTLARLARKGVPFAAQGSCRAAAAELGRALNNIIGEGEFVVTLANSGAEAVEAALKHAELSRRTRIDDDVGKLKREFQRISAGVANGSVHISEHVRSHIRRAAGMRTGSELASELELLLARTEQTLRARSRFLSLEGGFHGKTSGAVQLTHNEEFRSPFADLGPDVRFLAVDDADSMEQVLSQCCQAIELPTIRGGNRVEWITRETCRVAALFVEVIQGEGGVHELPHAFLARLREVADKHEFPIVVDEIQTGMGRTGSFLAASRAGLRGDYYLLSKGLGGGVTKVAALLVRREQYEREFGLIHSSTFGEDAYSASVARQAVEIIERDRLVQRAERRGKQLRRGLLALQARYPHVIEEVRGRGLMLGVQLVGDAAQCRGVLRLLVQSDLLGYVCAGYLLHEHGIRVLPTLSSPTTLRLEPSAYIDSASCEKFLSAMLALCEVLHRENAYHLTRFLAGAERESTFDTAIDYRLAFPRVTSHANSARRVAFVGHLIEPEHLSLWDESLAPLSMSQRRRYLDRVWSQLDATAYEPRLVRLVTGEEVELVFLGLCLDSEIIAREMQAHRFARLRDMVAAAVQQAERLGCVAVGLGGYTSIVTRNGTTLRDRNIAVTTGNSLTVAMGVEALLAEAEAGGIDLARSHLAAIGATGNIASVYCQILARRVPHITLIGRAGSETRLRALARTLYEAAIGDILACTSGVNKASLQGVARALAETPSFRDDLMNGRADIDTCMARLEDGDAPVKISMSIDGVGDADLIVSASNAAEPLLFAHQLKRAPVVICDISVPRDTDPHLTVERPDARVLQGGIVRLADNVDFEIPGVPLEKGHAFACMSETLLMGLDGLCEDYSYGPILPRRVIEIGEIAVSHGFSVARAKHEDSY